MENNLVIFTHENFGNVRVVTIDDEPWMVGKDIAEALGYTDTVHAVLDHVDDDDRVNSKTQGQNVPEFGQRGTWLINESGLYSLIFSSKLPAAKEFKRWVTKEVLPTLRKTGSYTMNSQALQATMNWMSDANERLEKLERYCVKAGKMVKEVKNNVGFINYMLSRNSRAKKASRWKMITKPKLKALAEYYGVDEKKVLHGIYISMEDEYDFDLRDYIDEYKFVNDLDSCSAYDVVDADRNLRQIFDSVIDGLLANTGLVVDVELPRRKTVFDTQGE